MNGRRFSYHEFTPGKINLPLFTGEVAERSEVDGGESHDWRAQYGVKLNAPFTTSHEWFLAAARLAAANGLTIGPLPPTSKL